MARLALFSIVVLPLLVLLFVDGAIAADTIYNGGTLRAGNSLTNGPYKFIMQSDCNLVLYGSRNKVLWASGTNGKGNSCRMILQNDGNLVVYTGSNNAVWASGTNRATSTFRLTVQSDGNVVIYSQGSAIWATNTVQTKLGDSVPTKPKD